MPTELSVAAVPEYPKIETLYERDPNTFKVIPTALRLAEFAAINRWHVTEKIDGTNVRVALTPENQIFFGGRTNEAQMPPFLLDHLRRTFSVDALVAHFRPDASKSPLVTIFGEGYGPKIQKGGGNYRSDVSFRIFDILIDGVWLSQDDVEAYAHALGVGIAPVLGVGLSTDDAASLVNLHSEVASNEGGVRIPHEGVIARSSPLMLDRMGRRVMWKLKAKDFAK